MFLYFWSNKCSLGKHDKLLSKTFLNLSEPKLMNSIVWNYFLFIIFYINIKKMLKYFSISFSVQIQNILIHLWHFLWWLPSERNAWSVHTLLNGLMTERRVWKTDRVRITLDTHPLCWSSWKVFGTILHGTLIDCHSSDQHNECCLQTPGERDHSIKHIISWTC